MSKPRRRRGGQPGNTNAVRHGFYTTALARPIAGIDDVVADLQQRQAQLSAYLDHVLAEGAAVEDLAKLFGLHAQTASRLGRLLRDQRIISGANADKLTQATAMALDAIRDELAIDFEI